MATCLAIAAVPICGATAEAQDPLKTLPKNYWLEFENPQVRVVHVHYGAHETLPVHDHPNSSTLYVYLTEAGAVRFEHKEGGEFSVTRPDVHPGDLRLNAGRVETHSVANDSDLPTDFLRVELKLLPSGKDGYNARLKDDGAVWTTPELKRVELDKPRLRIVRWGIQPGQKRTLAGEPGSLWIALGADARVDGNPVHSGQAWAAPELHVENGAGRTEFLEVVEQ